MKKKKKVTVEIRYKGKEEPWYRLYDNGKWMAFRHYASLRNAETALSALNTPKYTDLELEFRIKS